MSNLKIKKSAKPSAHNCCETDSIYPDHSEYLPRMNRLAGQLGGIQKMIQDRRYCVDILVQFRATMAAMRSIEIGIFERHLQHCVSSALHSKDKKEVAEKIKELTDLMSRRTTL